MSLSKAEYEFFHFEDAAASGTEQNRHLMLRLVNDFRCLRAPCRCYCARARPRRLSRASSTGPRMPSESRVAAMRPAPSEGGDRMQQARPFRRDQLRGVPSTASPICCAASRAAVVREGRARLQGATSVSAAAFHRG